MVCHTDEFSDWFLCLQVIKAALAQVKAVAQGGVTAEDINRAK